VQSVVKILFIRIGIQNSNPVSSIVPPQKIASFPNPFILTPMTPAGNIPKHLLCIVFALLISISTHAQHLSKDEILIVYNSSDTDSKKLADFYQSQRNIPQDQSIGLDLPNKRDISRADFDSKILRPLRDQFDNNEWWQRARNKENILLPTKNKIRAIVLMRGVPLRISPENKSQKTDPKDPISPRDEASVDSELALFGIQTLPTKGILKNSYHNSLLPLSKSNSPHIILVTRIDAPSYATCKIMIRDAIETEKHGLWGRAYIDIANKIPEGDQWLEAISLLNQKSGIPTITDRANEILPKTFPLTQTAIYYGWYDRNINGPFLNSNFLFRPGAIAVHIHSFSAEQLTDSHKNWCAPLLTRGATATLGNVYEPYLSLSHHLDIFHDRLLKGWTLAEASWASMPVCSWQAVVIGDPLYRPFLRLDGTGTQRDQDRDFRAIRAAYREWPNDPNLRREKLSAAADKLSSGTLAEALALDYIQSKDSSNAKTWLTKAEKYFSKQEDIARQSIHRKTIE
jgi:uncharacterized protein (TIGR03790 family)